ncbi:hypothetical protein BOW51_00960 [Solemya velesiana gill symbiont]|uniref:Uncharacterized protein n=1 Tax=Solemya velesiana gill symbiont TaxID=1918948 RepID=A0A1T2KY50_9GAMM|nr:hypothetical protein BOW51_00960 [Solemya velesiana gill symbiont]
MTNINIFTARLRENVEIFGKVAPLLQQCMLSGVADGNQMLLMTPGKFCDCQNVCIRIKDF